jgi:hypothetical protein
VNITVINAVRFQHATLFFEDASHVTLIVTACEVLRAAPLSREFRGVRHCLAVFVGEMTRE